MTIIDKTLRAFNEEQDERFHQDKNDIETRYRGRWDVNMIGVDVLNAVGGSITDK